MPLNFATPPVDGRAVLAQGLRELSMASTAGGKGFALGGAAPQAMEPHPVYELGLDQLKDQKTRFEDARLVGWRYLLVQNQKVVQAAEISGTPAGGSGSKFSSLTSGYAAAMEDVFHKAEQLPEVAGGDFEIRTLRVPGVYVTALWLKDLQHKRDRFLLVPPVFSPFRADVVYDPGDLLQLLNTAATNKLAAEQKLTPP